jgi:hypothetical protein
MPHTQKLIIISLALLAGIGLGFLVSQSIAKNSPPIFLDPTYVPQTEVSGDFQAKLLPLLQARFGTTSTGYNSHELLYVYQNMKSEDFNGVETSSGRYQFKDGYLWHVGTSTEDAAEDIVDNGFVTLYKNIQARLGGTEAVSVEMLIQKTEAPQDNPPVTENPPSTPPSDGDTPVESPVEDPVMCTMDAKMCPDGSFVGRTAPSCAFAPCPGELPTSPEEIVCTQEQKEAEACIEIYAPVCASYQVQCVTTPCNPVPKSYPNSCFACADNNVISYTEGGVCASDPLSSE